MIVDNQNPGSHVYTRLPACRRSRQAGTHLGVSCLTLSPKKVIGCREVEEMRCAVGSLACPRPCPMRDTSGNPVKYRAKPIALGSQTTRRLAARAIPFDGYSRGAKMIEPGNRALRPLLSWVPPVIDGAAALTTTSRAEDETTRSHEFPLGSRTLTYEGLPSHITARRIGTYSPRGPASRAAAPGESFQPAG